MGVSEIRTFPRSPSTWLIYASDQISYGRKFDKEEFMRFKYLFFKSISFIESTI